MDRFIDIREIYKGTEKDSLKSNMDRFIAVQ